MSGGQRRRIDLALALIGDPDLIFLDEPTTGFDPAARRTAWGVVRALKELGKTLLLTTHYLEEAQELADRVAIVKDGLIVAEGPPDSLGPSSSRYRVSYLSEGRRVEHETDGYSTHDGVPAFVPTCARAGPKRHRGRQSIIKLDPGPRTFRSLTPASSAYHRIPIPTPRSTTNP